MFRNVTKVQLSPLLRRWQSTRAAESARPRPGNPLMSLVHDDTVTLSQFFEQLERSVSKLSDASVDRTLPLGHMLMNKLQTLNKDNAVVKDSVLFNRFVDILGENKLLHVSHADRAVQRLLAESRYDKALDLWQRLLEKLKELPDGFKDTRGARYAPEAVFRTTGVVAYVLKTLGDNAVPDAATLDSLAGGVKLTPRMVDSSSTAEGSLCGCLRRQIRPRGGDSPQAVHREGKEPRAVLGADLRQADGAVRRNRQVPAGAAAVDGADQGRRQPDRPDVEPAAQRARQVGRAAETAPNRERVQAAHRERPAGRADRGDYDLRVSGLPGAEEGAGLLPGAERHRVGAGAVGYQKHAAARPGAERLRCRGREVLQRVPRRGEGAAGGVRAGHPVLQLAAAASVRQRRRRQGAGHHGGDLCVRHPYTGRGNVHDDHRRSGHEGEPDGRAGGARDPEADGDDDGQQDQAQRAHHGRSGQDACCEAGDDRDCGAAGDAAAEGQAPDFRRYLQHHGHCREQAGQRFQGSGIFLRSSGGRRAADHAVLQLDLPGLQHQPGRGRAASLL
ncbi:hypothetical protein KL933_000561 [Ogataea haglerorum]|uniref:Uncharacterized protein n=1 Tax=Ogataea haglerorum TaxID=1937702 RepID=A0AAN6DA62_9ASCO|nr:hypothetical protein KL914_000203 [Ogataea haglerorum]KAG7712332.1 hypothetical protein KL950_000203 [Ogataea haglerorum]KAG7730766.1 hypothetical protein KL933_000561 [Ogataea haglerorum]KAG7745532.1 hypothetical protein KL932_000562 [Ogataea haglerorum]KAG7769276.1 hypothetical protein KL946_000559 [Ogataea haglerorum]